MFNKLVFRLKQKSKERQAQRQLGKLSDATLKDIGLSRSQINYEVRNNLKE